MSIEEAIKDVRGLNPSEDAILTLLINYRNKESDLYEANNRINDLLDIVKQKDRIIDEMVDTFLENDNWWYLFENNRESVIKYFEERCK